MLDTRSDIVVPVEPHAFRHAVPRLSGRLAGVGAIKIAAIGSSTTAGEGDIVPYPQRLESDIASTLPKAETSRC